MASHRCKSTRANAVQPQACARVYALCFLFVSVSNSWVGLLRLLLICCAAVCVNTFSAPDVLCLVLVVVATFPLPSTSWEWIATQSLKRRPSPYLQQPFWEFVELLLN